MLDLLKMILVLTPIIYNILLILLSIFNKNIDYIFMLISYWIFGELFNYYEKLFFRKIQGENSKIGKRPNPLGTKFGDKYDGCNIPIDIEKPWRFKLYTEEEIKNKNTTWGFPSGHSQDSSYVSTILSLYLYNKKIRFNKIYIILLWIVNLLVMYQRVDAGCHTILQVIIGDIIGIMLGIFSYYKILNKFFN